MAISCIQFWLHSLYANTHSLRFWLLWVFVNTSTLGLGFGLGCWCYIHFSGEPNPGIDFFKLPLGPYETFLLSLGLCLIQAPFLHRFRWRRNSTRSILTAWTFGNFLVLALIHAHRYVVYFILILFALRFPEPGVVNPDPAADIKTDYLVGAFVGAIAGLVSGGIVGLMQSAIMPTCKRWIAVSALSWSIASALAWLGMRYVWRSLRYGSIFLPPWAGMGYYDQMDTYGMVILEDGAGFFLELPYQLAIYGAVLGLVSSAILGVAMLALFPRRSRSAD
jgi:hypothetical protein